MINAIALLAGWTKSLDDATVVDAKEDTSPILLIEKGTDGFDVFFFTPSDI